MTTAHFRLLWSLLLAVMACPPVLLAEEATKPADPLLLGSRVLRRHVQIVAVPSSPARTEGIDRVLIESDAWKALLTQEGVAIDRDEWASAVDLLQTEVANSKVFRLVQAPLKAGAKREGREAVTARVDGPWSMLVRFGVGTAGNRVFINLVDSVNGRSVTSVEATADAMQAAVRKALTELEDKTVLLTWYCAVVAAREGAMIIDRGRLDGLRSGQKFRGYALAPEAGNNTIDSTELLLMKFGARKGVYEVVEAGQEYSLVKPTADAPILNAGDVLELPMITRPDREKDSRGRRVWDEIYK